MTQSRALLWARSILRQFHIKWQRPAAVSLAKKYGLENYQVYPDGRNLSAAFICSGPHRQFRISRETRVASLGSCFAREIKRYLLEHSFNYVQTEHNEWSKHSSCAWERVYTIPNIRQIFEYSLSESIDPRRLYSVQGEHRDLMRYRIAYKGTRSEALADLKAHSICSKAALSTCDVLLITVGQNEVWYDFQNEIYLAQRPHNDMARQCRLLRRTVDENMQDLRAIRSMFSRLNPAGTILVTLSPVPSTATFSDANVVQQSLLNKAILRVAIDAFLAEFPEVLYFPSFEIVTSCQQFPFERDNLHVRPEVVGAIMRAFEARYCGRSPNRGLDQDC